MLAVTRQGMGAPVPVSEEELLRVARTLEMYADPLPQMLKIYGYSMVDGWSSSVHLTIGMFEKKWKFHRDLPPTTVFVYGTDPTTATCPGPTIGALQGVPLWVTWQNHLPHQHILPWDPSIPVAIPSHRGVPTVTRLHSGIQPPQSDGNSFAWFTAGLCDVGDLFDLHLVIADRSFYKDGSIYMNYVGDNAAIHLEWQPEYFGEAITVNGKAWPFLSVLHHIGSISSNRATPDFFNLSLSNNLSFTVVGSDSTYLHKPIATPTILIAPSEIYEVITDFANSSTSSAELLNCTAYPFLAGNQETS
ncbi:hypothetical protein LUZ60_009883 [Juncus effusus]|nr:hypothetical protein LUZ60_009883 [Juncus effusus]